MSRKSPDFYTCSCGKRSYYNRKDAATAKRGHPHRRNLNVYRCPYQSGSLHLGHTPEGLRRGDISRSDLDDSQLTHHPIAA